MAILIESIIAVRRAEAAVTKLNILMEGVITNPGVKIKGFGIYKADLTESDTYKKDLPTVSDSRICTHENFFCENIF